jgi:PAS domain S-box-containing protein
VTKNVPGRWAHLRSLLPQGAELPAQSWGVRHRFIVWTAFAHAPALALFGWSRGWSQAYWLGEAVLIALIAAAATLQGLSRRLRSALAGLALVTSSAVLVQFSGGYIEAHFHYFIVVALVALYEDYVPFLLAIGYVAIDHGIVGTLAPDWVYNHADAAGKPWKWAAIHAAAILGESIALLGFWAGAQQVRARSDVVLDSTGDGIIGTNLEHTITFANPAAARMLGQAPGSLIGRRIDDVLPEVRQRTPDGAGVFVTHLRRGDGEALLEWSVNPTLHNGVVLGTVVALRDVTGRRRLEDQVVAQARQHAAIARLGQFALEARDLEAIFAECTREVAATLGTELCKVLELQAGGQELLLRAGVGWNPGLVGKGLVSAGMDSQAGYTLVQLAPVVVSDLRMEQRFLGPSLLREHGVVSGMSVVIHAARKPWGVLGTHTRQRRLFSPDEVNFLQAVANLLSSAIERHQAEQELRTHRLDLEGLVERRTAQLTEANRELEAFSYTVSHDLRSPLRSIDGFSRLLQQRYGKDLPKEANELLGLVHEGAIRMGSLIESVLVLSRVSRAEMKSQSVDLTAIANEVLRELAAESPGRRVDWEVESGLHATGDEGLLRLVLQNLLSNAWKFTGKAADARIRVRRDPQRPDVFVVEDNGAGFDMAHAGDLFQPFHRLHEANAFPGTGIGLATVSRILRRHGGTVWAEAEPGKGARFLFSLPDGRRSAERPARAPRPTVEVMQAATSRQ